MSTYVSNRNGGGQTDEQGHYRFQTKLWSGNVIGAADLLVKQNSPLARNVLVSAGDLKIDYTGYSYTAWNDADATVAIATADVTNPRLDRIVAFVDRGLATGGTNNPGYLKFLAVAGTPGAVPVKASDGAVTTAVNAAATSGTSSPWVELAVVRVEANATTIPTSKITDTRVQVYLPATAMPDLRTQHAALFFDHVSSGCVWSGDSYGSTRNASMTAGYVFINGRYIPLAAVTARNFTASRDTYVYAVDNLDGTASFTYSEVTNNNTSPTPPANSILLAIIITGAGSIANVGSINNGDPDKLLPIAASQAYQFTDSNGNLINPRDPMRKVLALRKTVTQFTSVASATWQQVTGLSMPFISPGNRNLRTTFFGSDVFKSGGSGVLKIGIWDGTVGSGTMLGDGEPNIASGTANVGDARAISRPAAGAKTYNIGANPNSGNALIIETGVDRPMFSMVELM